MNVKELKKRLDSYPDDLELFVNVEFVEEDDCGKMPISNIYVNLSSEDGVKGILEFDSPYI